VSWNGRPLTDYPVPRGKARYSYVFHWMRAARYCNVPWHEFKRLDRETQGQIVAFYETDLMLDYMDQRDAMRDARRRRGRK